MGGLPEALSDREQGHSPNADASRNEQLVIKERSIENQRIHMVSGNLRKA